MLRLAVETDGCSGFQYSFQLDSKTDPDDRYLFLNCLYQILLIILYVFWFLYFFSSFLFLTWRSNVKNRIFERDGVKLAVDKISYDFVEELIRSAFVVCFLAQYFYLSWNNRDTNYSAFFDPAIANRVIYNIGYHVTSMWLIINYWFMNLFSYVRGFKCFFCATYFSCNQ